MKRRKGGLSVDKWECIAENLQKARKKCGYSYQKLADKTGLSKSTLQRYESGAIRSLPLEKAEQLAQALNITPAELLGWHEPNQYKELGNLDRLRELLRQTAEEAVELAQAALKVIRAAKGTTPLDGEDAVGMLIEEIADVQNCIAVLSERLPGLQDKANKISAEKMKRWKERLR